MSPISAEPQIIRIMDAELWILGYTCTTNWRAGIRKCVMQQLTVLYGFPVHQIINNQEMIVLISSPFVLLFSILKRETDGENGKKREKEGGKIELFGGGYKAHLDVYLWL